jgi:hypothetical protein
MLVRCYALITKLITEGKIQVEENIIDEGEAEPEGCRSVEGPLKRQPHQRHRRT